MKLISTALRNALPFALIAIAFLCTAESFAQSKIVRLEYFIDADPGTGNASTIPITADTSVTATFDIDAARVLASGFHTLYLRSLDDSGRWSIAEPRRFYVQPAAVFTSQTIEALEYFFDADPGTGNAAPLSITADTSVTKTIDLNETRSLGAGFHQLYVRAKDQNGAWSITESRPVYIGGNAVAASQTVQSLEYFIDTDPNTGNATPLGITADTLVSVTTDLEAVRTLAAGFHTLYARPRSADGAWGITESRRFYIQDSTSALTGLSRLARVEYFFNSDPGFGNAASFTIAPPADSIYESYLLPLGALANKTVHLFGIRTQTAGGLWSITEQKSFYITVPAVRDDSVIVAAPFNIKINVRVNDNGNAGDTIRILAVRSPLNGTAVLNADTTITYTPNGGFKGTDKFRYLASNGTDTDSATVTVKVLQADITNWSELSLGTTVNLNAAAASVASTIAVGEGGKILKSTNGGTSWTNQVVGTAALFGITVAENVSAKGEGTSGVNGFGSAVAVGVGGTILRSENGGDNWSTVSSNTSNTLNAVASVPSISSNKGSTASGTNGFGSAVAVGVGGTILRSGDGGSSWQSIASNTSAELRGIAIAPDATPLGGSKANDTSVNPQSTNGFGSAVAVGVGGTILRSNDGGSSWSNINSPATLTLNAVAYFGTSTALLEKTELPLASPNGFGSAVAVGVGGTILRSVDGGSNWLQASAGTGNDLYAVQIVSDLAAFAVGSNGAVILTTNRGEDWTPAVLNTNQNFNAVAVRPNGKGYAIGNGGTGFVTQNGGGILSTPDESRTVPKTFDLLQNYPNPFNPSTTIRFSLPKSQQVALKVYDVLGRTVAVLINERKAAGNYAVNFNASRLASGVYFYRLQAEDFVSVKKMILVK